MNSVEAVILEKRPMREADELVVVYSKEKGKKIFLARGIKKPRSKHRGALQTFNWTQIYFVKGKSFSIITDTVLKDSFSNVKNSLDKIRAIRVISNLLNQALPIGGTDYVLWWQLIDYFSNLEKYKGSGNILALAPTFFTFKMLSLHGLKPELENCLSCRENNLLEFSFSTLLGGLICRRCISLEPTAFSLSPQVVALLKIWQKMSFKDMTRQEVPPKISNELIKTIEHFTRWHLGVPVELTI